MAGKQRERELARLRAARAQQRREEERRRRLRVISISAVVLLVVALVAGAAIALGGDDETPSAAPSGSGAAVVEPVVDRCEPTSGESPSSTTYETWQPVVKKGTVYRLDVETNCGDLVLEFDSADAPNTTDALTFLADRGYFDHTRCHRLTTDGIHVVQCGDPSGDGTGGPGFGIPDENLPDEGDGGLATYPRGTVAMAEAPGGLPGSQFFIVHQDSPLPPDYTVVGELTEGLDVIDAVAEAGTTDGSSDGEPKQALEILQARSSATTKVKS